MTECASLNELPRDMESDVSSGHALTTAAQGPGQGGPFCNMQNKILLRGFVSARRKKHEVQMQENSIFLSLYSRSLIVGKSIPDASFMLPATITTFRPY